jgi:hypothetical protein
MVDVKAVCVEHGYQIDIYQDGKEVYSSCRDFGIDHEIKDLENFYIQILIAGIEHFREKADEKIPEKE